MTGYLKIIIGPMFSGKTTELIRIYNRYKAAELKVLAINYKDDIRYHSTLMSTHNKQMIPSINCKTLSEIDYDDIQNYDIILINEGQFFEDIYKYVDILVNKLNKRVYVCGLDGDFQRKKFGHIFDIIPIADDIIKIKGICNKCKMNDSIFTYRKVNNKEQKIIGNDIYLGLCRKCYNELN